MFLQDRAGKISEGKTRTDCQRLGFCVCQGAGDAAKLFVEALVRCMKPLFTPPRKKGKKKDNTNASANGETEPFLPPEASKEEVEPPHVKQLKSNQKLLVQGMLVMKIQKHAFSPVDASGLDIFGASWAAAALAALRDEPANADQQDIPDEIWFHIGHINLNNWGMTILRLVPVGPLTTDGFQRLEVHDVFVNHAIIFFAKLLGEPAFDISWDVQFFQIVTNADRVLTGQDVVPNWLLVKPFQPHANLQSCIRFWQGLRKEKAAQKKRQQRTQQQSKRTKKKIADSEADYHSSQIQIEIQQAKTLERPNVLISPSGCRG